jgi:hypothetical protein
LIARESFSQTLDEGKSAARLFGDQCVFDEERIEPIALFECAIVSRGLDDFVLPIEDPAALEIKRSVASDFRMGQKAIDLRVGRRPGIAVSNLLGKTGNGRDGALPILFGNGGDCPGHPKKRETMAIRLEILFVSPIRASKQSGRIAEEASDSLVPPSGDQSTGHQRCR